MLLKGWTETSKELEFSLKDGPVYLTSTIIALSNIENSPLIKATTVVRGDEETGVFEGDNVYQNDELIGLVVYNKGFCVQLLDGSQKRLSELEHIKIEAGNYKDWKKVNSFSERTSILFKYYEFSVSIQQIIKIENGKLYVSKNFRPIKPEDMLFYTGYYLNERSYFFGDIFRGGIIVCHDYEPAIKRGEEYTPLRVELNSL